MNSHTKPGIPEREAAGGADVEPPLRRRLASSRKTQRRTVRIASVDVATLEEMHVFFGGGTVKARLVQLPAEDRGQPARIVPFPTREPPPPKAASHFR